MIYVKLSIVIPTLNEAAQIEATLTALAPLRARGAEVIVADGGSDDHTSELARPLADVVVAAPRGRAQQMTHGARHARGEVLLFLHADTQLPPDADRLILDVIATRQAQWGRFDVNIRGRSPVLKLVATLMNLRSRWTGIATGDQAIFVQRALFDAVGGFPEQPLMEDIELTRRLKRRAAPACLRARVTTSGRRWESRGVWRTIALMWWLRLQYFFGVPAERLARQYR